MKKLIFIVIFLPQLLGAASSSSMRLSGGVPETLKMVGEQVSLVAPLSNAQDLKEFSAWLRVQNFSRGSLRYDDKGKGRASSSETTLPGILRIIGTNVEIAGSFERAGQLKGLANFIGARSESDLHEHLVYIVPDPSQGPAQRRSMRYSTRLATMSSEAARAQLQPIIAQRGQIRELYQKLSDRLEIECRPYGDAIYDEVRVEMTELFRKVTVEFVPKVQSIPWVNDLTLTDQDILLETILPLAIYKAGDVYLTMLQNSFRNIAEQEALERIAIDVGLKTVRYFIQNPEGEAAEACFVGDSLYSERVWSMLKFYYEVQQARSRSPRARPLLPHTVSLPVLSEPSSSSSSSSSQAGPSGPPQLILTADQLNTARLKRVQKEEEKKWEPSGEFAQRARQGLRRVETPKQLVFDATHKLTETDYRKFAELPENLQVRTRMGLTEKQQNELTILESEYGADAGSIGALLRGGAARQRRDLGAFKKDDVSQSMPVLPSVGGMPPLRFGSSEDAPPPSKPDEEAAARERARKAQAVIDMTKLARGGDFFAGIVEGRGRLRRVDIERPTTELGTGIPQLDALTGQARNFANKLAQQSSSDSDSGEGADWALSDED